MALEESEIKALKPDALAPAEVEAKAETIGVGKANLAVGKQFILGIMAGMFIAMGGMFMLLVKADTTLSFLPSQLLGGLVFCLGLFLVVTAGAELFTGNCLMICGKLSNKYSWGAMFKNWIVVFCGNLVGSLIMVGILYLCNYAGTNGGALGNAMINVAAGKMGQDWFVLMVKGIMCNFLVCLAVWMSFAARTVIDKLAAVLLPITAFVACGFEHCVANMFFLPMGVVMNASGFAYEGTANLDIVNVAGVFYNISAATVGNIIGGCIFVGIMYWLAYAKRS